jgi:type II secretory pathway pseudopilin PulG
MRHPKGNSSAEIRGFTLVEAALAIALFAIVLLSMLQVRSLSVAGARRTLLDRSAQRLAFDLAAQIEAGVFDEPEVGRVEYGIYIDNRERYRKPGSYNVARVERPAYPENEDEPSYPPGLKFEWEITEDGQPAEVIPNNPALAGEDVQKRYNERAQIAENREREMSQRDPAAGLGDTGGQSSSTSGAPGQDPLEEEEDEEQTEEWRTLTIFVRADTTKKPDDLLFELERRFLWTYPDRVRQAEEEGLGASGAASGAGAGGAGGSSALGGGNTGDKR